jgi:hypothetical protein
MLLVAGGTYAGVSWIEYVGLVGSLILGVSGWNRLTARFVPPARWLPLAGLLCVSIAYLPIVAYIVRAHLTNQQLSLSVFLWSPSDTPLKIDVGPFQGFPNSGLTSQQVGQLKAMGLRGTISAWTVNGSYGSGPKSYAVLILQHPVSSAVELPEPDAASVIYVQRGDKFDKYPPSAPVLRRVIQIAPGVGGVDQDEILVQLSSGASQGFGCCWSDAPN